MPIIVRLCTRAGRKTEPKSQPTDASTTEGKAKPSIIDGAACLYGKGAELEQLARRQRRAWASHAHKFFLSPQPECVALHAAMLNDRCDAVARFVEEYYRVANRCCWRPEGFDHHVSPGEAASRKDGGHKLPPLVVCGDVDSAAEGETASTHVCFAVNTLPIPIAQLSQGIDGPEAGAVLVMEQGEPLLLPRVAHAMGHDSDGRRWLPGQPADISIAYTPQGWRDVNVPRLDSGEWAGYASGSLWGHNGFVAPDNYDAGDVRDSTGSESDFLVGTPASFAARRAASLPAQASVLSRKAAEDARRNGAEAEAAAAAAASALSRAAFDACSTAQDVLHGTLRLALADERSTHSHTAYVAATASGTSSGNAASGSAGCVVLPHTAEHSKEDSVLPVNELAGGSSEGYGRGIAAAAHHDVLSAQAQRLAELLALTAAHERGLVEFLSDSTRKLLCMSALDLQRELTDAANDAADAAVQVSALVAKIERDAKAKVKAKAEAEATSSLFESCSERQAHARLGSGSGAAAAVATAVTRVLAAVATARAPAAFVVVDCDELQQRVRLPLPPGYYGPGLQVPELGGASAQTEDADPVRTTGSSTLVSCLNRGSGLHIAAGVAEADDRCYAHGPAHAGGGPVAPRDAASAQKPVATGKAAAAGIVAASADSESGAGHVHKHHCKSESESVWAVLDEAGLEAAGGASALVRIAARLRKASHHDGLSTSSTRSMNVVAVVPLRRVRPEGGGKEVERTQPSAAAAAAHGDAAAQPVTDADVQSDFESESDSELAELVRAMTLTSRQTHDLRTLRCTPLSADDPCGPHRWSSPFAAALAAASVPVHALSVADIERGVAALSEATRSDAGRAASLRVVLLGVPV